MQMVFDTAAIAVPATGTASCTVPGPGCGITVGSLTSSILADTTNPQLPWGEGPNINGHQFQVGNWSSDPRGNFLMWNTGVTSNTCLFGSENGRIYGQNGQYTEYELAISGQFAPAPGTSCSPISCASLGKNCGSIADGCGNTLNCGSCSASLSCGGGGTANLCGFSDTATHDAYCSATYHQISTDGATSHSCPKVGACVGNPYPQADFACNADLCWQTTGLTCVDGTLF